MNKIEEIRKVRELFFKIAFIYNAMSNKVEIAEIIQAKLKFRYSDIESNKAKNITSAVPTSIYWTGWMKTLFSTSIKKKTRNVNPINRIAYFTARVAF